jgi:hypothetical protein
MGGEGVEIDTSRVEDVKKAPGDNDAYFVFVDDPVSGRVRYVGDEDDARALGFNSRTSRLQAGDAGGGTPAAPASTADTTGGASKQTARKSRARTASKKAGATR